MPTRRAVFLDAMGTLVHCPDPAGALWGLLRDAGFPEEPQRVGVALRAEIAYYRAHMHTAVDAASLDDMWRRCCAVLAAELRNPPPPDMVADLLRRAFTFVAYPEVDATLTRLRERGVALAVVSNWDVGLTMHLDALDRTSRFDAVVVSAVVGVPKPDAEIFHTACRAVGVAPGDALHCGDDAANDRDGAEAAGLHAVLLDRSGATPGAITSLGELPARVEAWLAG